MLPLQHHQDSGVASAFFFDCQDNKVKAPSSGVAITTLTAPVGLPSTTACVCGSRSAPPPLPARRTHPRRGFLPPLHTADA